MPCLCCFMSTIESNKIVSRAQHSMFSLLLPGGVCTASFTVSPLFLGCSALRRSVANGRHVWHRSGWPGHQGEPLGNVFMCTQIILFHALHVVCLELVCLGACWEFALELVAKPANHTKSCTRYNFCTTMWIPSSMISCHPFPRYIYTSAPIF